MNDEYWKFAESEQHFNQTQAGIRSLASGWMLAAFAAIALLLKSEHDVNWLISPALLIGIVSLMATIGLVILWINDQMVYQRLLDCGFIIALKMEYDDPTLPPLRAMMMYSAEGKGMSRWMTYFYTIPMSGFLAITGGAAWIRKDLGPDPRGAIPLVILVSLFLIQLSATLWASRKKADVGAAARAALFGDSLFASMFDGSANGRAGFATVVARHRKEPVPPHPEGQD